jgi:hypothetical protein
MARKKRTSEAPADQAALDALVAGVRTPEQLEAVFRQLKQRMV